MRGGQRLLGKDVGGEADVSPFGKIEHCVEIHHSCTANQDEARPFLHRGKLFCPQEALILRRDASHDNHQARASQDLIQGSRLATQGLNIFGGQPWIVGPNATTERAKQWQDRPAKIAQSDQTDVLSEEGESLAVGSQAVLFGPLAEIGDPTC